MTIEFNCSQCHTLLRVADEAAGKPIRCPQCSAVQTAPSGSPGVVDAVITPSAGGASQNPFAPPAILPQPQGPPSLAAQPQPIVLRQFDPTDALNRAWKIYIDNIGNCLLAALSMVAIIVAAGIVLMIVGMILAALLGSAMGDVAAIPIMLMFFVLFAAMMLVSLWLTAGMTLFCLKLARGQQAQISDIFAGGPWLWAFSGVNLAVGLLATLGFMLCIVPGFFVAIFFFPAAYLVIDRGMSAGEALSSSMALTEGNRMNIFLLMLISMGVSMIAGFIPGGGLLVLPLNMLMMIIGYLLMTGQLAEGTK